MASEQLRILIVGNGGREHAFAWKLSESPLVDIIYVAPGNGGTGMGTNSKITNANVKGDDYPGLVAFAQKNQVNLVVPGPEAPLVDGIQGYFQAGISHMLKCRYLHDLSGLKTRLKACLFLELFLVGIRYIFGPDEHEFLILQMCLKREKKKSDIVY
ncbi:unnamed protein product [Penicillium nalgiovense]|nr:unnamed protein product [Penicillium nalgiovense]